MQTRSVWATSFPSCSSLNCSTARRTLFAQVEHGPLNSTRSARATFLRSILHTRWRVFRVRRFRPLSFAAQIRLWLQKARRSAPICSFRIEYFFPFPVPLKILSQKGRPVSEQILSRPFSLHWLSCPWILRSSVRTFRANLNRSLHWLADLTIITIREKKI